MKLHIYKTNRRVKESPYLTACKEQDGLLGNIEMNHYMNVDDVLFYQKKYRVDPGSNLKRQNYSTHLSQEVSSSGLRININTGEWGYIADELNKPGVFDKLAKFIRGQK